jgi:hypothetical protein
MPIWGVKIPLKEVPISSIDLHWGGAERSIGTTNKCASVIQTLRKARQFPVAATPSFGFLTIHYADGTTNQFYLSPSGRTFCMEIANHSGGYAISMGKMLGIFESVGLLQGER